MKHTYTCLVTFKGGKKKQEFSNSLNRLIDFIKVPTIIKVEILLNSNIVLKPLYTLIKHGNN